VLATGRAAACVAATPGGKDLSEAEECVTRDVEPVGPVGEHDRLARSVGSTELRWDYAFSREARPLTLLAHFGLVWRRAAALLARLHGTFSFVASSHEILLR
jgi:uncharacterized lipoprotein